MLWDVYFAADWCRTVANGMEVSVKLGLVVVELQVAFGDQVVLATYVSERSSLSERDVYVIDS